MKTTPVPWRRCVALLGMLAVAACAQARQQSRGERADVAVLVARVLDPATGRYSGPSAILVRGGRIVEVQPRARFTPAGADSVIDLGDMTVLPGLIDAHVHLAIGGTVRANALADLRAGFTTVVDLGSRTNRLLALRDSINAGHIPGPRVLAAGMWVGTRNGVCEFNGLGIAGGPDAFRQRVRENADAGSDVIKVCVSGWPADAYARPDEYEISDDALAAVTAEAHAREKLVIAHDISRAGVRAALRHGVDGLAHAAYLDDSTAEQLRERGTFLIPTLASLTARDSSAVSRALVAAVALAHRTGLRLVFGTDGGVLPHGENAREMAALTAAGIPPIDVLRMATINAARALRLDDSVGTVARGMSADLIAVRGDPLVTLDVMRDVRWVMLRGSVVR
ncbi:MAG TPA: amidohydrolase family protein [Gemmatimonadaceae bacterium]|nr:amidohydrolase family protein [Gemmatimonadaceae bacterium]